MTAAAADKPRKTRKISHDLRPLAASVKAYKGAKCMIITSGTGKGYYAPADSAKIGYVVGYFDETVDNSAGAIGALSVNVEFTNELTLEQYVNDTGTAIDATNRGGLAYALDDLTATGAVGSVPAGLVYDVTADGTGVWVQTRGAAPSVVQSGTSTLVAGTKSITGVKLTANSLIFVTMRDPGAGAITAMAGFDTPVASRNAGAGSFVVNAIDDTKATIGTAVCTFDWMILN
jgi:hypothetical protein